MTPDSITVRAANAHDISALCVLVQQYWEFDSIPDFHPERIASLLRKALAPDGGAQAWLAEDSTGQLVGYLLAVTVFSLEYGGLAAEIDELFVRREVRGTGLGVALLAAAEAGLSERGVCCLQLQLATANLEAREFYRRRGFTRRAGYELWDKPLG
jgi:GNAT superfamily N-acetyltransferase